MTTEMPTSRRTLAWFHGEGARFKRDTNGPKRWRRGGGMWLLFLASALGAAWTHHRLIASLAGTALLLVFAWAYLFLVPLAWFGRGSLRRAYAVCGVLLGLALLATAVIGASGLITLIFVAAAAMTTLPTRVAVPCVVTMAAASTVVPRYIGPWHDHTWEWSLGASIAFASLAVYGFTRLVRANHELAAAREEVAQLAAERERLRIARDLHDLLGHSLTTVTVKAGLARRLIDTQPERARTEIAEIEQLARESLADVRSAIAGYREVRLATELATAREVLSAAGIDADLPGVVDGVDGELGGLFGWVVREGVTNVVRHSRAHRVRISLDDHSIEIVDDGLGCRGGGVGSGLAGLAERASAAGGRLEAGPVLDSPTGFRLRVEVPA